MTNVTDDQTIEAEHEICGAGDEEPVVDLDGRPAPLLRREPVFAAFGLVGIALGTGLVRALQRGERESSLLFAGALAVLPAVGWTARHTVTPLAFPRRDAETPLIDAPAEMLE